MALSIRKKCIIFGAILGAIAPVSLIKPAIFRYFGFSAFASSLDGFVYHYYTYLVAIPLALYLMYALSMLKYEDKHHYAHYRWRSLIIGLLVFAGVNLGLLYGVVPHAQKIDERLVVVIQEDVSATEQA